MPNRPDPVGGILNTTNFVANITAFQTRPSHERNAPKIGKIPNKFPDIFNLPSAMNIK